MFTRERLTRWTSALRANPEQQHTSFLASQDYTKFCCLGKLCEVSGIARSGEGRYKDFTGTVEAFLPYSLAAEFGHGAGDFESLSMPVLVYNDFSYYSAATANDSGVPWVVIADHFDKYYPCSDEQREIN